jgi:HAE1 family hydrophobic/amphiphilic exporter-1
LKITEYSIRRRLATTAIALSLAVLGLYGLWHLPVNFLPDMTYPMVKVNIFWSGATPEEIGIGLADPIERQMMTVDGLDYLESSSIEGMYSLIANFRYGADINTAYQDVTAAMARVARKLPKDIDAPIVFKADPTQSPILQLTVRSDRWDLVHLRTWTDEWLQDQILAVPGVAGTDIVGGLQREIRVYPKPTALEKYGLTVEAVSRRLRDENVLQLGGRVTVGPREIIARTMGEYGSLDEIRNVVLIRDANGKVTLGDVADVVDSHREARVISRLGGLPAVKLSVLKQSGANTVEVARAVQARLAEIKSALPAGVELGSLENQATYIVDALKGVQGAAVEAAILVMLIVWLFLGSWRQVVVIAIALPLILLLNFGIMKMAGFSLNIFSLGGLVVAIGVLVDNSILVIEAISRERKSDLSAPIDEVALKATSDIGSAVVASTLAFLALFVPFLIVPGLVSLLFRELILVVAGIVLISLIVSVTLTPMLTALLLRKPSAVGKRTGRFGDFFERVTGAYGRLLQRLLGHPRWVLAVFAVAAVAGGYGLSRLGSEFLPQMDDGRVMVKVKLPTGASLAETDRILRELETQVASDRRIESVYALSGGVMVGTITNEIANEGELDLQLVPRARRSISTQAFIAQLRPVVAKVAVPGSKIAVSQMKVKGMRKLGDADIEVKIKGPDMVRLFDLARQTAQTMTSLKNFANVYVSMDLSKPEYQVRIDRVRAAEMGVAVADIADTLRSQISGSVATSLREGGRDYDIRVMIPESRFGNRGDIEDLLIPGSHGDFIRLRDLADVVPTTGPVEIVRDDQIKTVIVRGDAAGASVGKALADLRGALDREPPTPGYERSYGGQAQMIDDMTQTTLLILAFALFFSFIVLAVQFNDLKLPALILGSVPFCLAGMSGLLLITGKQLGAPVIIGVLVVVAAVVNSGVLLFTYARLLRETEHLSVRASIIKAACLRLRPRIMVASAILIGLVPLALALEAGGEMLQPMAIAAIGGLMTEVLVSLFLMPCLYLMANRDKRDGRYPIAVDQ